VRSKIEIVKMNFFLSCSSQMLDQPNCLHWLLMRLCSQMLDPPHSLHPLLLQFCSQMLAPPHFLHWLLLRLMGTGGLQSYSAESMYAPQTGATQISEDVSNSFIYDNFLGRDNAHGLDCSSVSQQVCIFDCTITQNSGDVASSSAAVSGLAWG
jgi:hypothetical protein